MSRFSNDCFALACISRIEGEGALFREVEDALEASCVISREGNVDNLSLFMAQQRDCTFRDIHKQLYLKIGARYVSEESL